MAPVQQFVQATDMRAFSRQQRVLGRTIGFVPTMGYLHEGHVSLIHAAKRSCDVVIVSIYVNPTQFSANEDFGVYPRSRDADLAAVEAAGGDAVFLPETLYAGSSGAGGDAAVVIGAAEDGASQLAAEAGSADGAGPAAHRPLSSAPPHSTWVEVEGLSSGLCSTSRPHFFRGVATVVAKLFNVVDPDAAFFGKKDYQQWRILERMARDLDFAVRVVGVPVARAPDGLALSSRNAMLAPEERARAPAIQAALAAAKRDAEAALRAADPDRVAEVAALDGAAVERRAALAISEAGLEVDYVSVVDALTLQPVARIEPGRLALIAAAAKLGSVRLIDNLEIGGEA